MSEIGSFVVSLKAKFEGYLSEIEKIKKAMSQVGADTKLGKNLAKELATVEKQVDALGRKLNQRISSEGLITRLKDLLDGLDNKIKLIGLSLLGVKYEDLSPDYITDKFKDLENELDNIGKKMLSNFNLDSLKGNEKLVLIFKDLGISMKDVNLDNFKSTLTSALEESKKKAGEYREEIARLKKELQDLNRKTEGKELFADGGAAKAASKLMEGIDPNSFKMVSLDTVDSMKQSLMSAVDTFDNKELAEKLKALLEKSFNVTDAGTLANNLKTLLKDMVAAAGGDLEKNTLTFLREKLNAALSSLGSEFNLNDILNFKNYTEADTAVLDTVRQRLTELLKVNDNLNKNGDLTAAFIEKLMGVFANGDYAAAIRNIVLALDYYVNAVNRAKALNLEDLLIAINGRDDANLLSLRIAGIINGYKSLIEILLKENAALKEQLNLSKEEATKEPRTTGGDVAGSSDKGLNENIRLVRQYTQELENAKNAELLVGKIEGIAQRWFSIYAAVNMVTNAVRSMKSTIEELDKTITEIAIVTDMSLSDLWGLMDSYTSMAREYAASISGVYKVSQLYYQQGLQTADVMALTESTLKMARISGLDYADATNYMTNAVRSFKMEMTEADRVVDVYSAIAAKSATDVSELAVAMSKTASSAEAVGSSFENTTAMMAVMIEATRESSLNIGSAMKSIISRYGELKEDPSKLVDSEGEELSLNKVDTALQSVGISIHNAQGQFREFDDVIMELAEAWDTIDVNTLRYIATVMAGNRQQSRFLALVGSGERLKQLAADAADAENASQLQFLKTLDSIGAKSQLLLTSLLSLYTSSGLEGFYKGILDITNNIISSFTAMPTVMNLPIAAIAKFGMTFWSLANIVKSVFAVIVNEVLIWKMKTVLQSELVTSKIIANGEKEVTAENDKLASIFLTISNWLNRRKTLYDDYYNEINKKKSNNEFKTDDVNILKQKLYSTAALGLNVAALGLNLIGGNLKASTDSNLQRIGGGLSIGGSAASGAAMGAFAGPEGMVIGAIAGAAMGALLNWNVLAQDIETRLANAKKASEEANNKALQELAEAKSLLSSIDKLKELSKTRYDSIEAELEYLELNNTLALQYPELTSEYAKTGEAIVDLSSANSLLQVSLRESAKATQEAASENFKLALTEYEAEQEEIEAIRERLSNLDNKLADKNLQIENYLLDNSTEDEFDSGKLSQKGPKSLIDNEALRSYYDAYIDKSIEEFAANPPHIDAKEIDMSLAEQLIYNYILEQINEYASIPSREAANVEKLLNSAKVGLITSVNDYLKLLEIIEDENPLEEVANSSLIISKMVINNTDITNIKDSKTYDKALKDSREKTKEYREALIDWFKDIDIDEYNRIMEMEGKVSSSKLIEELNKLKTMPPKILQAFTNLYKDNFDIEKYLRAVSKIDNSGIKDILSKINEDVFNQLSDTERHAILDYGKLIESLIASGLITQNLGLENLNKYMAIWSELRVADIAPELREAAEGLLRAWDGTREGLEGIITSLDGIGSANSIINAVRDLISSIPQNLNTIFSQISSSVASEIKTMDDAIKDLSSGVDMEKAIEYANKLGLSLKDFELDYSTGLFTLDDTQKIILKLVDNVNKLIGNALKELDKYLNATNDKQKNLGNINSDSLKAYSQITDLSNDNDNTVKEFKAVAELFNLEPGKLLPLIQEFFKQSDEVIEGGFLEWLKTKFGSDIESLTDISKNAQARGALLVGNIADFLKLFVEDIDDNLSNAIITSLISNGKVVIDDLRKIEGFNESGLEQYIILYQSSINDSVDSIAQEVYGYAIESVKNGTTTFEVTPENSKYLDEIDATISDDGKTATVNWTELKNDTEAYKNKVGDILSHVPAKTAEEIIQNLEDVVDNSGKTKAFDTLISSYDNIDASQMPILKEALGEDIWELLNVHYDEIAKSWLVNLSDLRAVISNSDIDPKNKNKYLANIDKELQDTSVDTALREIGENYNDISYDSIKKLADSLGKGYDEIKGWFDYDESTGHYSISLTSLLEHYDELAAAGDEAASRVLLQIIDGYLEVLLKVSTVQTSGLTKLEDMQNFASEINYAGNLDAIYRWNDSLKAYVLNSEGLEIAASEAKLLLDASIGTENENIKKLLINRTKQTLANNIDAMGFVSALQSGDTVLILKSADEFTNAVNDYIAYCTGLDENININADTLESMLASGGYSAVMAAQEIASWKGETLSASDINTLYRSEIDKLNAASELLSYSIGEIINLNTWNILKGIDGFHASEIANGQYVVTSVGNLIEAHEALYKAMSETNEATVRELNAEWAKILNLKSGGEVVEYLSNAAEMTYEAFGEALANVGIEAASLKGSDLYKDLGNGKIEITNFEAFSALLGLSSESTEAYIAAYKEFNAQKIQHENQLRQAIEDEISSLSTAKLGDKIDLTTLYFEASDRFSETAMNGLEESLLKYGAVFDHGILDLSEATSIPNIINIIKNLMQNIDILTEQDFASLADALDNFLKNIVDLINKGIKGTLTNKDKLDLKDNLSNYGIDLNEYDFTKTSEGLLLTEQATMRIWNQLNLIDKLLALLVFKELSASLIANNEKFRTMSSTMNRIVELLEKIATSGNKVSDARLNLYKAELAVAEEIAKVRATSADDSYKFMEADLPAALDNPINYIENWGKAFNVLKEGGKSGFIDAKDFARVVNEMNNIAGLSGEFEFFGQKLDGNLSSASSLIESAFSHIKSVDGKAVVDVKAMMKSLGDVGTAFETGALEADGKVTQGIHAVAQANIDMLDGMIAMLETIVGMQDALSNVDTNFDNELNLDEIFPDLEGNPGEVTKNFANAADEILKKAEEYPDLKEALNTIQIDNHTLADLLKEAKDGAIEAEINYKAFADIMNGFYKMSLSDDYDENNIYESLKQVMEDSGMEDQNYDLNLKDIFITVHQGKVAKITWDDKNIKDVIKEYIDTHKLKDQKGKDGKTAQEQAKEALSKIFAKGNDNNPEVTLNAEELEYFVKLNGATKIVVDKKTGESYYEYHGQLYRTAEDVLKAIKLELEFPQLKNLTTNYNPEDLGKGGEFTISASLGANLVVKITDSGRTYEYKGHQGETMDEAITAYLTLEDEDYRDLQTKEAQKEYLALYKLNNNLEDKPHFNLKTPKGFNPTQKDSKDFLDYLNSTEEINGKDLEEKFNIKTGIEGPLSVDLIKEVANLFGVDYAMEAKLLSLSVSLAEGTSATLLNLLTGESATANLEITPTIVGSTTSGEGNNSTITLGEQTITAPVKILPTSVLIGDNPEQGIPIPTEQLIKAPVKINPQGTPQLGDALLGITIETEQLVNAPIRVNPTDVQLNGNTFLYDKALTVYAAISNLKLLPGEGGTTAVEGGTGNPLSELAKALLEQIVTSIWTPETSTYKGLKALAYLGEILFLTNEATVNTPPKIVVPQDWIGEKSLLKVDKILTFLYNLEYKPTEAAKAETILVDTPGPLETIDIEQPYRIVFVPEGEGGENEPQQPAGLSMGAELIQGGIIAGNSDYFNYLESMYQYLLKGGTLSQAGANSISLIASATEVNPGTQNFYERFFGEDGGLFNIDELGNISAMTTLLLDMGEALGDGDLLGNMLNLSTLVLQVNSTDSDGLAALWTVLTELKDAAATFMQGPWKDVTSVLNDLSSLTLEAKTLTIDTVLTGQVWALELLKDLSSSTMNLNLNLGGTTTVPPQGPLAGLVPATYPAGTMSPMPYGLINPMMPMGTVFAPLLGVGMPPMQGAMPYGSMASTTPVTPPTQEQPKLDTDELEKGIEKVNELISNISTSMDNIAKATSEFTSQADAVTGAVSNISSAVSTLQSSISTFATDAGTGASNAEDAAKALKGIPKNIPIDVNIKLKVSIDSGATGPLAKGTPNVEIVDVDPKEKKVKLSQAKGTNLALPKGNAQTLMGELGPELYVTNGRYYVAGQSGPEFVDLPKDAIVFNHVKTRLLLKNGKTSGHGKPVTNEKNAISFATGTPGGPAMASASAALAALKQLRAMWASLLKSSAKDLGSLAGRGGGGGGDDAGKYVQPTTTTADIQRWYNWLRLIDKIEKDITYQEKLQKKYETDRVANGLKIFDTLKERLKLLDQEILRNERLADLQKSWYDNKRKELEESSYGKIFTYDENGLQQYVGSGKPGSGLGLDILEHLTKRDVRGEAIGDAATSKAQLKYLASVGFNLNDLIYNDDGTKVVKKINQKTLGLTRMPDDEDTDASELYTKLMENFWSRVDGWRDELDSLYDSYQQQLAKIEDNQTKLNLIIEGFVKNELSVEKELLKAVEAREQAVIDKLQEQKDALEKANANYIKGILKALEKERQIEQKNDQQENLTKLQRLLSILQRSGGGAAQIKQLQDQIAQSLKDMYFNDRLEEINAVQEASDKLLEKLDQLIQILSETLEYQKKNGLLWNQVREIMEGGDEFATAFYDKWVTSKSGESALNMEEDLRAFKESFLEWVGFRESKEEDRLAKEDMESIANSEKYGESNANYLEGFADDKERSAALKAAEDAANTARDNYLKSHEDEDEASREANARAAAEKAYHESLQSSYMSTTGNKEANQLFAENYGSWLENRRISDANDFTNTETFKLNENVFKNAMQAYYLEHRNDEGVSEQELWQNAINAGLQALEEDITENYLEALENSALVIGGKAVSYTWDPVKGKMKKNSKITYGEGTSLNFDDAKEVLEGKKLKHYLHVKGMGDNGWVLANSIYTGERIYSLLAGHPAWLDRNGNLADMINGMNGYYGANGLTNTVDISDLKSGSLKFPGTLIPLENGGFATLGKNGNTVRISDFSSITFDKKNPDKKISKLGKNMTITAILTPDMSKMENLLNPMTIKTNGTIKKKLNDLLAAGGGNLKNLLQYMGGYDINEIRRYATGGMNYSTGPAWLDGTKTRPEAVLNSSLTSFLRNDLLGNSKDSLKSIVYSLQDSIRGAAIGSSSTTNNDGMVIENIDVTFSPGVISNDYDMRQASEVFKNEIVKIARKSGSRSVSRR